MLWSIWPFFMLFLFLLLKLVFLLFSFSFLWCLVLDLRAQVSTLRSKATNSKAAMEAIKATIDRLEGQGGKSANSKLQKYCISLLPFQGFKYFISHFVISWLTDFGYLTQIFDFILFLYLMIKWIQMRTFLKQNIAAWRTIHFKVWTFLGRDIFFRI